jgi:lipopolysaccharide/colanic/teichoic acid biosynthesis glycosyltransferase
VTGLAQIQGRGALPHEEKLEIDVQYVEQASLALDLRILWRTVTGLVRRKGIYQRW